MTASKKEIENKTNFAISKFLQLVLRYPLIYFSENDLQSILYMYLYKEFKELIPTKFQQGYNSKTTYKTVQVHCEYGSNDIKHSRMDLCLLTENGIKEIDDPNLKNGKKYLKPFLGIELGTEKTHGYKEHVEKDIEKLKNVEKGFLIYIFKDTAVSEKDSGRGSKTEKKYNKIKSDIEKIVKDYGLGKTIIPLFFIRYLQKQHQRLWGKCEYYNFTNQNWKPVGLGRIEIAVRKLVEVGLEYKNLPRNINNVG